MISKTMTAIKTMIAILHNFVPHRARAYVMLQMLAGLVLLGLSLYSAPARAQQTTQAVGPSTGLPLPRFVSTRAEPINVRVGPGTRYNIAWVFEKPHLPVEIVQEFDVWRKIRYVDGDEGWIHQNLLSGARTGLTRPFGEAGRTALYARAENGAPVRAWLSKDVLVNIDNCRKAWCKVTVPAQKDREAYTGYVVQFELWGVYPDETVN